MNDLHNCQTYVFKYLFLINIIFFFFLIQNKVFMGIVSDMLKPGKYKNASTDTNKKDKEKEVYLFELYAF